MAVEQEAIIHVLISLSVLLFAAKIFAEIFNKLKLPAVLGELVGGIIVGPFALGSLPVFYGKPVVILNETVLQIGQIAGIVILFIAGLHITPREFLRGGAASFIIVAIISKLVGCGLPSLLFLRNKSKAMIVGIGMISRGEVGLIVAGIGVTSGVLSSNIYTTVIIMVAVTTLITPLWLRKAYNKQIEQVDTN